MAQTLGAAGPVVIRPRATGFRLTLLRQETFRPLGVISVLILIGGVVRGIADPSSIRGTITLIWLPVLALATLTYLQLYYRNVSWGVYDGTLVHTGVVFQRQRIPVATIREFVAVTVTSDRIDNHLVLILGDEDRYLGQVTASNQYTRSDLHALARAAQAPLLDGPPMALTEFTHRYPRAVPPFTSAALAVQRGGPVTSLLLGALIVIVFLAFAIVMLPWR